MSRFAIGDEIYCPIEFWSGRIVDIAEDHTGELVAIIRSHVMLPDGPFLHMPISAYERRIRNRTELN